jgi:hypothetical protein
MSAYLHRAPRRVRIAGIRNCGLTSPRPKLPRIAAAAAALFMLLLPTVGATPAHAATSLQNAGLEVDANANAIPDCWQKGGYGSNRYTFTRTTDAHSGRWAEQVRISSLSSGDRKLVSTQDSGTCAPTATAGQTYRLSAWYKSDIATRFVVYLRGSTGGWSYWTSSPTLPASGAWTQASWTTPPLPAGRTHLSFGLNLTQVGSVTADDYSLTNATTTTSDTTSGSTTSPDTTAPDTAIATHPADPTTATDGSFSFTSTEANSTFRCTLDGVSTGCTSPKTFAALAVGAHSFSVVATDAAGNTDQTPATFNWTVQAPVVSSCGKQTDWVAPQVQQATNRYLYTPMTDAAAAACVTDVAESVPANATANADAPSDAELQSFRSALSENALTPEEEEWYPRYVTGRPGIPNPSTDELIQWGAHKWGIPEDWLRAQYTQESDWRQSELGDLRTESTAWRALFPAFSCPTATQCYESLGITQLKWHPDGSEGAGTEPIRWKSTAFNIDYQASIIRFEYDNPYGKRSSWGDSSDHPLDQWLALGAWFSCYPYGNAGQRDYVTSVQQHLAARDWPH